MLAPIVEFFERLIENFSWRRLGLLVSLLVIAGMTLWTYETYTQSFRLGKIEKQVALLEHLSKLSEPSTLQTPALRQIHQNLERQLADATSTVAAEYVLLPWAKKALAAASAWLALALLLALASKGTSASFTFGFDTAIGMLFVALPFVVIGATLPTFEAD